MAKVEQVEELKADDRWKAQRLASRLDGEIRELKVAMSELDSVRPKKSTYVKRAGVFFLDKRDVIIKAKRAELKDKEHTRHNVGLQLRPIGPQL